MEQTRELIIKAATGAVSEVIAIVQQPAQGSRGYTVAGIVGTGELLTTIANRLEVPLLDDLDGAPTGTAVAISGYSHEQHRDAVADLMKRGLEPATLVHADTTLGPWVTLGAGCLVSPGVRITGNVVVGEHCQLHTGAIASHDDVLEDYVVLSPGVTLCGGVTVRSGATVFAGATVMPGVTIGSDAVVGAGALVNAHVAPGSTVVGVPAKPLG